MFQKKNIIIIIFIIFTIYIIYIICYICFIKELMMKTYHFYYCDSLDSHRFLDYKRFTTSASTYSIASHRFISFYSRLNCDYINFFHFYRVENSAGRSSLRSFKISDSVSLSEITTIHNNKELT